MIDPLSNSPIRPVGPTTGPAAPAQAGGTGTDAFAVALREQLERVSQIQSEANEGVQRLLTGESQNLTEVFTAARKAEVAFTLLMETRNKLVDAYNEIRQIRV